MDLKPQIYKLTSLRSWAAPGPGAEFQEHGSYLSVAGANQALTTLYDHLYPDARRDSRVKMGSEQDGRLWVSCQDAYELRIAKQEVQLAPQIPPSSRPVATGRPDCGHGKNDDDVDDDDDDDIDKVARVMAQDGGVDRLVEALVTSSQHARDDITARLIADADGLQALVEEVFHAVGPDGAGGGAAMVERLLEHPAGARELVRRVCAQGGGGQLVGGILARADHVQALLRGLFREHWASVLDRLMDADDAAGTRRELVQGLLADPRLRPGLLARMAQDDQARGQLRAAVVADGPARARVAATLIANPRWRAELAHALASDARLHARLRDEIRDEYKQLYGAELMRQAAAELTAALGAEKTALLSKQAVQDACAAMATTTTAAAAASSATTGLAGLTRLAAGGVSRRASVGDLAYAHAHRRLSLPDRQALRDKVRGCCIDMESSGPRCSALTSSSRPAGVRKSQRWPRRWR